MRAISTYLYFQIRKKKIRINLLFTYFKEIRYKHQYNIDKTQNNC